MQTEIQNSCQPTVEIYGLSRLSDFVKKSQETKMNPGTRLICARPDGSKK
jgi:hypothetical protein